MKIVCITPTRGDRPQFVKNCKRQMKEQTRKPDLHIIIDRSPDGDFVDLTPRIYDGIQVAKSQKADIICIIEDDDYYPKNYIEKVENIFKNRGCDYLGDPTTTYLDLKTMTFKEFQHSFRASLFTTSFRADALDLFNWPEGQQPGLDLKIWQFACKMSNRMNKNQHKQVAFADLGAVGIKHGIGRCAGNGHNVVFQNDAGVLRNFIHDQKSYEFYCKIMEQCTKK